MKPLYEIECFGKVTVKSMNEHTWIWDIHEHLDIRAENAREIDDGVLFALKDILQDRHSPLVVTEIKPLYHNPFNYENN